jgi:predicted RNase H-like nuclease (RuvC/YqgF family)
VQELRGSNASLQQSLESTRATLEQLESEAGRQSERLQLALTNMDAAQEQLAKHRVGMQELEQAVHARDALAEGLRQEVQTAQEERGIMGIKLERARARNKTLAHEVFERDKRITALKQDLAVHAETLAAIRQDVNRVGEPVTSLRGEEPERILEPLGHEGPAIVLNRKVVTVGRTSDNDACVPSKLVSRHHARLLIGPNAVIVEDAGSTNGCYVNDRLIQQQLMRDGDVLSLGDLRYRLCTRPSRPVRPRDNVISIVEAHSAKDDRGQAK